MLSNEQIEKNFQTYINLLTTNVKREGIDKLVHWLESKDAKVAPASTIYHCAYSGGLIEHCLNVYRRLKKLIELEYPRFKIDDQGERYAVDDYKAPYSEETITLVALLHDISKVNYYDIAERNTKNENGEWVKVPFYQTKDISNRIVFGSHSMNSYYMITKFIKLNYQEELAILYHMGGFDTTETTISTKNVSEAFVKSPLALLLHQADAQATYLDESINE